VHAKIKITLHSPNRQSAKIKKNGRESCGTPNYLRKKSGVMITGFRARAFFTPASTLHKRAAFGERYPSIGYCCSGKSRTFAENL
jgi:hypothetical protein